MRLPYAIQDGDRFLRKSKTLEWTNNRKRAELFWSKSEAERIVRRLRRGTIIIVDDL